MAIENQNALIAIVQKRDEEIAQHRHMGIDLGRKRRSKTQMMSAGSQPQSRQLQNLVGQPLFHAVGHTGHQNSVRKRRQMMAMLLAGSDRGQNQRSIP